MKRPVVLLLACMVMFAPLAHADAKPFFNKNDPTFVEFAYDKHQAYTILTKDFNVTHIELADDEVFVGDSLGDKTAFKIDSSGRNVFIKPLAPDVSSTTTLLTNKRTYQLNLKSSVETSSVWYRHVSWSYPDAVIKRILPAFARPDGDARTVPQNSLSNARVEPSSPSADKLDYRYTIGGDQSIRPVFVADDGKQTWFKLKSTNEIPALFVINAKGEYATVNAFPLNGFLIALTTAKKFVLKLDDKESVIERAY